MFPVTDPILIFTILALVMLVAPVFARRLRMPDLVLLLGFGALLGPNGLHVLDRNMAVTLLGSVGLLYIMFLAGIEIDLYRFSRSYRRSIVFGLLTFLIPQSLGTLAGRYVLGLNWPASLLLASMFASHTLLAYPLASRLGISRCEPVAVTVGATIITDTLALLVLAVIADSARGIPLNAAFWATLILGMLALSVLSWKGIPALSRWFFRHVSEESNAQFLFVIATVCGTAWLSHFARMEPIIGAFLAGAAFNRLIPENSPLMNRVTFAGNTLFIPFFLISVGMLVDLRAMLENPQAWLTGATMIVMVVLTKFAAAQVTRLLFGYSRAAGQVMFGLSVVQAAATLAAVVVGYNLRIFDEAVLNGAIGMILVTCPLGSWAVYRYGRRLAAETPARAAGYQLEQRLLVPVSNPESAIRLLDLAFLLRNAARPGGIYPLTIARDDDDADAAVAGGEKLLGHCLAHAASADIPVIPELRVAVNASDGIVLAARELRISSLIIGWGGKPSASVRIFGTVAHHLVENCPARMLFCRLRGPLNTVRRVRLLLPPLAVRRRNMEDLVRDAKILSHQIGAELCVCSPEGEAEPLLQAARNAKPECRVAGLQAPSWEKLVEKLIEETDSGDIILLASDRRNGLLWTPALDHLPELLAEQLPETHMLIDYPSLPSGTRESGELAAGGAADIPLLMPFELNSSRPLDTALREMAAAAFADDSAAAQAAFRQLQDSAASYPVELAPGTALVHARFGDIPRELLMVCHAPESWPLPGLPVAPRIILVLLGSKTRPPEHHLKTLSLVARWMRQAGQSPEWQSAHTAEGICALLRRIAG